MRPSFFRSMAVPLSTLHNSPAPLRMIILGAPGSGKGTLSSKLMKKYPIKGIGLGDLLRAQVINKTEIGRRVESIMKTGALLDDQTVLQLVEPELSSTKDHWILDGFPRKGSQALLLDESLSRQGDNLNLVINLEVPDDVILERIESRWIHPASGRVYNSQYNPPKVPGKDDITGEPLTKRPDDDVKIFSRRLSLFHEENSSLLHYYQNKLVELEDGAGKTSKVVTLRGKTSDELFPMLEEAVKRRAAELVSASSWTSKGRRLEKEYSAPHSATIFH